MKRTWKVLSDSVKREACKDVRLLMTKGHSVSKARAIVAQDLDVRPNSLYNWGVKFNLLPIQHSRTTTSTRATTLTNSTNGTSMPHIVSIGLNIPGKGHVTLDHTLLGQIAQIWSGNLT